MGLREVLHDNLHDDHFDKGISVPGKYIVKSAVDWETGVPNSIVTGSDGTIYFLAAGKDPLVDPVGDVAGNWNTAGGLLPTNHYDAPEWAAGIYPANTVVHKGGQLYWNYGVDATAGDDPASGAPWVAFTPSQDLKPEYPLNYITNPVWTQLSANAAPAVNDVRHTEAVVYKGTLFQLSMVNFLSSIDMELVQWYSDGTSRTLLTSPTPQASIAIVENTDGSSSDLYVISGGQIYRYSQDTNSMVLHASLSGFNPSGVSLFDFGGKLGITSHGGGGTLSIRRQDVAGGINFPVVSTVTGSKALSSGGMVDGLPMVVYQRASDDDVAILKWDSSTSTFVSGDIFTPADPYTRFASFYSTKLGNYLHLHGKENGTSTLARLEGAKAVELTSVPSVSQSYGGVAMDSVGDILFASFGEKLAMQIPFKNEITVLDAGFTSPTHLGRYGGSALNMGGSLHRVINKNLYRLDFS